MDTSGFAAELEQLGERLRAEGWAAHVTVERLLQSWEDLAVEVSDHQMTIDDYTNDVCSRDGLAIVTGWATPRLAEALNERTAVADAKFTAATTDDGRAAVGRYFRIAAKDGWWWHRCPVTGPLAAYPDGA